MDVFTDTDGSFSLTISVFIFRISSANFHPRKEFKAKSIRGALNVFDNSPRNSLSHSASIKSSGPGRTSHIWISLIFSDAFMVSQSFILLLLSLTDVQLNHTVSIRSRWTVLSYQAQMCVFSPHLFLLCWTWLKMISINILTTMGVVICISWKWSWLTSDVISPLLRTKSIRFLVKRKIKQRTIPGWANKQYMRRRSPGSLSKDTEQESRSQNHSWLQGVFCSNRVWGAGPAVLPLPLRLWARERRRARI